jgi:hypothetical protein
MSRPLTKSPPIQFRIPIELWPFLQARAERKGQSVGEYVAASLRPALEADFAKDQAS